MSGKLQYNTGDQSRFVPLDEYTENSISHMLGFYDGKGFDMDLVIPTIIKHLEIRQKKRMKRAKNV